jgi:FkbM family methyltransferase
MSHRALGRLRRVIDHCLGLSTLGLPITRVLSANDRRSLSQIDPMILPKSVLEPGGTVVDVGANVGNWAAACRSLLRPANIMCFEPQPSCVASLRKRFSRAPDVEVRELAIGRSAGKTTLQCWPQSELSTTKKLGVLGRELHGLDIGQMPADVEVRVSSLDDELRQVGEIRLLKVDVQGSELDVVEGASEVLDRTRCLVVEVLLANDYYADSTSCTKLLLEIERRSKLRLSHISRPATDQSGCAIWADAVMVRGR